MNFLSFPFSPLLSSLFLFPLSLFFIPAVRTRSTPQSLRGLHPQKTGAPLLWKSCLTSCLPEPSLTLSSFKCLMMLTMLHHVWSILWFDDFHFTPPPSSSSIICFFFVNSVHFQTNRLQSFQNEDRFLLVFLRHRRGTQLSCPSPALSL